MGKTAISFFQPGT